MKNILVIDDSKFDSAIIAHCLYAISSQVQIGIVNESSEAVGKFLSGQPDLVLLDISMPEPDGFTVLSELNELPQRKHTKIVMFSGSTNPSDRENAIKLGADHYIVKPSSLTDYQTLAADILIV